MSILTGLLIVVAIAGAALIYLKVSGAVKTWQLERERAKLSKALDQFTIAADISFKEYQVAFQNYNDLKRRHADVVASLNLRKPPSQ